MQQIHSYTDWIRELTVSEFLIIWVLCFLWCIGGFTWTHYRNKRKGLYLDDPHPDTIIFSESFASGRSHKSWYTKMGGASNCLKVMITSTHLFIRPLFMFKFLGPRFDLIHAIPLESITNLTRAPKGIIMGLDISFNDKNQKQTKISLYVRKLDALESVLKKPNSSD